MRKAKSLAMGDAPFAFAKRTTASLTWGTSVALLPALAWGLYCFGAPAAVAVSSSLAGALLGEALASGLRRRFTLGDGTAFLTGLLVGMSMPPGAGPLIPAVASLFATGIVKGAFGGLGSNWMNPALAGVAFALINWPSKMSAWMLPHQVSGLAGISGATPLGMLGARYSVAAPGSSPMELLAAGGMKFSDLGTAITNFLNQGFFSRFGAQLPNGYVDLLLGNKAGALGEISSGLILVASIFIIARKMIRWEVPASIIGAFTLLTWTFGGLRLGNGLFSGDILFSLMTGSFLLVAFFMAPDPVTSPSSRLGMVLFGVGIGSITFLLRTFGASAEGAAFAVILLNCAVPALARMESNASRRRTSREGGRKNGDR